MLQPSQQCPDCQSMKYLIWQIPEELYGTMTGFLATHPTWDHDRLFTAALSLFLLQNGTNSTPTASQEYRRAARIYLDSLFTNPNGGDK